jgi:hypothetical protein
MSKGIEVEVDKEDIQSAFLESKNIDCDNYENITRIWIQTLQYSNQKVLIEYRKGGGSDITFTETANSKVIAEKIAKQKDIDLNKFKPLYMSSHGSRFKVRFTERLITKKMRNFFIGALVFFISAVVVSSIV